ncbi:anti-sigma factor RsbA family regulatory protein [Geodermatophilus sp. SYSU D00814]
MRPAGSALRHDAFVYDDEEEFLALSLPFLREGLEAGEGAVVAHTRRGLAAVRDALGPDAESVTFVDVGGAYTRPVRTLAAYHAVYADELGRVPSLRAVADVQVGPDPGDRAVWTAYEAAFNRSFAHLPAWVLCTYDTGAVPDEVREDVWRTHPQVVAGGTWQASDRFDDVDALVRALAGAPDPPARLRPVPAGRDAEEFREHLARELAAEGVPPARALDALLAATEVHANAVRHGGGVRAVRAGRAGGRFVCEVVDAGPGFDDPLAGYLAPRPGVGTGLWVARQLTWQIDFARAADGFTARIVL